MNAKDLKPGMIVWCKGLWRYLIYEGRCGKGYEFSDYGDCMFVLKEADVENLEIR